MNHPLNQPVTSYPLNTKGRIALVTVATAQTQSPPLSLLCLSAILEEAGYLTEILDLAVYPEKESILLEELRSGAYSWIGFTGRTAAVPLLRECIDRIRAISAHLPILLGGIHASALPERTLRELKIDAVCIGDGEGPCVDFADRVRAGQQNYWEIPGIAALDEQGVYRFSEDLQHSRNPRPLPTPNWKKIKLADYQNCPQQYIRRRQIIATVITTKGCPFKCAFCARDPFSGSKLIHRDPDEVVNEIEYLVKNENVGEIHFVDDIFNLHLKYAKEVLRKLRDRRLDLCWKTPNGIWMHSHDEEWFTLLQETGCYQVGFGIESGSPEILRGVGKQVKLEKIPETLELYRQAGISTFGFFILGLPGETQETMETTIRFACGLSLDHVHVGIFTPTPGSPLFARFYEGDSAPYQWENYFYQHQAQELTYCELSARELRKAIQSFYLRFYSRPGRALNLMNDIRLSGAKQFISLARHVFA